VSEHEAHLLLLEYMNTAHSLGEAIWSRLELWSGISFGLIIVLAYFATERLTRSVTALLLSIYIAFTL